MTDAELVFDQGLTIRVSRQAGSLALLLSGELDLASAPALDEQLREAEASDARAIVLDLRDLSFIDSIGLRSILVAARNSQLDGNRLGIVRGDGEVARLLEITGIDLAVELLD